MLVFGLGTGGTGNGLARKIKERCPNVIIVGADPMGSAFGPPHLNKDVPIEIEGIGYVFLPTTSGNNFKICLDHCQYRPFVDDACFQILPLDRSLVDEWYKLRAKMRTPWHEGS